MYSSGSEAWKVFANLKGGASVNEMHSKTLFYSNSLYEHQLWIMLIFEKVSAIIYLKSQEVHGPHC